MYFGYALFFAPREDGSGVGGSVYWVVELMEKLCFSTGVISAILVWGTGEWERGIRWPRRWAGTTNRGLRGFNCKLVVMKESWWRELVSIVSFFFSYGLFSAASTSSYRFIDHSLLAESEKGQENSKLPHIGEDYETSGREEDLAPGGDYIKLLLLPKPFSPSFRENWDLFRMDYWEKENERRAVLLKKFKEQERKKAKEQGGWLWWTGYRGWKRGKPIDVEKTHQVRRHGSVEKDLRRHLRTGSIRSGSHSRNSSRSGTPLTDLEDSVTSSHVRRGSTASNASRKKKVASSGSRSRQQSATPEFPSPLVRDNSYTSISSMDSEHSGLRESIESDNVSTKTLRSSSRQGSVSAASKRAESLKSVK